MLTFQRGLRLWLATMTLSHLHLTTASSASRNGLLTTQDSFSLALISVDENLFELATYSPRQHSKGTNTHLPSWNETRILHYHSRHPSKTMDWISDSAPHGKKRRNAHRHDRSRAFQNRHRHFSQELHIDRPEPTFDRSLPSAVKAQLGSSAFLSCRIHNLNDKSVSWIRNVDSHILTIDRYTFIADSRFVTLFDQVTETWTLQIKFVTAEDAGIYECQVSSEPKKSHFVTLRVITPRVEIPGGSELHVRSGSDVVLKCVISRALEPPPYVFWYHNRVSLTGTDGGLIQQALLQRVSADSSVASLVIRRAGNSHAGNYTCSPSGISASSSVVLHILNGEHPAAMQHGSNSAKRNGGGSLMFIISGYFLFHFQLS